MAILSDLVSPLEVDHKTYDQLKEILRNHFTPQRNVLSERYIIYSQNRNPNESIIYFIVALKYLESSWEFSMFLKEALLCTSLRLVFQTTKLDRRE